ncbi:MAG: protein BatD [Nitrospira sp.]|nr:protein BatD [bacterium]MBL7048750.1 protein BatD [Nitrospira sp.]
MKLIAEYKKTIFIFLYIFLISATAFSEDVAFQISANRNIIQTGDAIQLNFKFDKIRDVPVIELPDIEGFSSRYLGPSTEMSIVNGKMTSSITYMYRLVALKTGIFAIGPFSFKHNNDTFTSNALKVEVSSLAAPGSGSTNQAAQDRIFLVMEPEKTELYINEEIPLKIKLYVNGLSVRNIRYPELKYEGFSVEELGKPRQYQERKNGVIYDVVEFNTTFYATKTGTLDLGPAVLGASIIVKRQGRGRSPLDDFFGNDPMNDLFGRSEAEPIELTTERISISVLPLPEKDRPEGFDGAVGRFSMEAGISPASVNTGDPITMKISISGNGNSTSVTSPLIKIPDNIKVYDPQVTQDGNTKIFEQIFIPLSHEVTALPEARFSFFNPASSQYETIVRGPFSVNVAKTVGSKRAVIVDSQKDTVQRTAEDSIGRDIIYIKESPGDIRKTGQYLYNSPLYLGIHLTALIALAAFYFYRKKIERLKNNTGYARRLKAPDQAAASIKEAAKFIDKNMTAEFHDSVFSIIKDYISDRFNIVSAGITAESAPVILQGRDVDTETMQKLQAILDQCDLARYASATITGETMRKSLTELKKVIERLERLK